MGGGLKTLILLLSGIVCVCAWQERVARAAETGETFHFRGESVEQVNATTLRLVDVASTELTPGDLISPNELPNAGALQFDGRKSIVYGVPGSEPGFAENFTWEGFFLTPASNRYLAETGIADRLVTQFAFDKGNWTRLAIGLVADRDGKPRLSVELEGFDGRSFEAGDQVVTPDRWHHFALVHEGTAAAARLRWYLDYELTGELLLGGQANQNTLRPPGKAPFTIGARLHDGRSVNRGFEGLIDEVRLTPRPLSVEEFLRCDGDLSDRVVVRQELTLRDDDEFWQKRHRWARKQSSPWREKLAGKWSIDALVKTNGSAIDDAAFLRRLSLTIRGRIPSLEEVEQFLTDLRADKRLRAIDGMLASPEWADGWVGYWQDVLAENPSVVFPTLNNSGAFRQWIYESFRDNKPFDRFASELLLMEGDDAKRPDYDGPASFALATGNDVPMAMRAHVALKAFAAVDLKCARCHDSPVDDFRQDQLFLLAAYLNGGPLEVPASSVAAIGKASERGLITTSLKPGQKIIPESLTAHWSGSATSPDSLMPVRNGTRAELAALLTSPGNSRFSDVIVNRVWKRLFGMAVVEPVDEWQPIASSDERKLLQHLSAEFVECGYDLKWLVRRILGSAAWQATRPRRQLMSAEQVVDSLFLAVGKDFQAETLGVNATDPGAVQLPRPRRAWQFAALPNERDRPALGMPVSQTVVDVMTAFGWSGSRQQPRSDREQTVSARQPLLLFNGLMSQRIVRLSESSAITGLCLRDVSVRELVRDLFLTVLGRLPDEVESRTFTEFLSPEFHQRRTGMSARPPERLSTFQPDWRKHLEPEQTTLMLAAQERVARGELPTTRLTPGFRERVEDVLWALVNSPEFVVVP